MSSVDSMQAEQAAIGEVLFTLASGFRELDASKFESIYVEDADWTNAFGTVLHGRENIVSYRQGLFARNGRWLILADMYMDARDEQTYAGHDLNR